MRDQVVRTLAPKRDAAFLSETPRPLDHQHRSLIPGSERGRAGGADAVFGSGQLCCLLVVSQVLIWEGNASLSRKAPLASSELKSQGARRSAWPWWESKNFADTDQSWCQGAIFARVRPPPARDGMAAAAPSGGRSALLQFGPPRAKEQNEAPGTYPPRWTLAAAERAQQGSGSVSVTWGVQAPVSSSSLPTRPEISLLNSPGLKGSPSSPLVLLRTSPSSLTSFNRREINGITAQ